MFAKAGLWIVLLVPLAAANQNFVETHSEVHPLVTGGTLHIRLRVGDVHITKGADQQNLHVRYTIRSNREPNLHETYLQFETQGVDSKLDFHSPYRGNTSIDAEIEVPDPTGLDVQVQVGGVHIDGIAGDKTLVLRIGDIHVGAGDATNYQTVRASTIIGDIEWQPRGLANSFNYGDRGWLGHKLKYDSDGKYELRAEVSIGDIDLR